MVIDPSFIVIVGGFSIISITASLLCMHDEIDPHGPASRSVLVSAQQKKLE
jgi:hypothetical protein